MLGTVSSSPHIFDRAGPLANTTPREQWRTEGGLGIQPPPRNSEDIGGILDRMSKKNRRLDFLL